MDNKIIQQNSLGLMKGRLGIFEKEPYAAGAFTGTDDLNTRLEQAGGSRQQERMIQSKLRSLDRAVWYSYQGAQIIKTGTADRTPARALINPNKLKQDYDDKIVSVRFDYGFAPGDIFEWVGTNTHWLIYLQDLTELAYFRGDIRKCSYEISWEDEKGRHTTYAAIRGPVETTINSIQKHGISVDTPNLSLNLLLPLNEDTISYFQRYGKFYLNNIVPSAPKVCWRVEALDWISTPGILEIAATEYYANKDEDDIENGIVGALIVSDDNPNSEEVEQAIIGETFIKPKSEYIYTFSGSLHDQWSYDRSLPIESEVFDNDDGHCCIRLKWNSNYSGQFNLSFGSYTKTIVVESLF